MLPRRYSFLVGALVPTVVAGLLVYPGSAHGTVPTEQIQGSGSSWASNSVNQWGADVAVRGLHVVYVGAGSGQGRREFADGVTDFAVSDVPYLDAAPIDGEPDTSHGRVYAYVPFVAGGIAITYHLVVNGQLLRTLRLSLPTVAKIFLNQISYWDDPAILADNNNRLALPHVKIVPVVPTDDSGATYVVTSYLAAHDPLDWKPLNGGDDAPSEYFPVQPGQVPEQGAAAVMNYVASASGNGAIAYDEYAYPLTQEYPVAKIENAAGFFTLPTGGNVGMALRGAKIITDKTSQFYGAANLTGVFDYPDNRAYPLSSYSYLILPTSPTDAGMDTRKRQALAEFIDYGVCGGQREVAPIGDGVLPLILVKSALNQLVKLKKADPLVDLTGLDLASCTSPTFTAGAHPVDTLHTTVPRPQPCDRVGRGPCA